MYFIWICIRGTYTNPIRTLFPTPHIVLRQLSLTFTSSPSCFTDGSLDRNIRNMKLTLRNMEAHYGGGTVLSPVMSTYISISFLFQCQSIHILWTSCQWQIHFSRISTGIISESLLLFFYPNFCTFRTVCSFHLGCHYLG